LTRGVIIFPKNINIPVVGWEKLGQGKNVRHSSASNASVYCIFFFSHYPYPILDIPLFEVDHQPLASSSPCYRSGAEAGEL
jgi:hypothetical protein